MRVASLADLQKFGDVKGIEAPPKPDETAAALRRLADAIEAQAGQSSAAIAQSDKAMALVRMAMDALAESKAVPATTPKPVRVIFERDDKGRIESAIVTPAS